MIGGPEEWIPQKTVLEMFHVDPKTLKKWRDERGFPRPFFIGRIGFYRATELRLWQDREREKAPDKPPPMPKKAKKKKDGIDGD